MIPSSSLTSSSSKKEQKKKKIFRRKWSPNDFPKEHSGERYCGDCKMACDKRLCQNEKTVKVETEEEEKRCLRTVWRWCYECGRYFSISHIHFNPIRYFLVENKDEPDPNADFTPPSFEEEEEMSLLDREEELREEKIRRESMKRKGRKKATVILDASSEEESENEDFGVDVPVPPPPTILRALKYPQLVPPKPRRLPHAQPPPPPPREEEEREEIGAGGDWDPPRPRPPHLEDQSITPSQLTAPSVSVPVQPLKKVTSTSTPVEEEEDDGEVERIENEIAVLKKELEGVNDSIINKQTTMIDKNEEIGKSKDLSDEYLIQMDNAKNEKAKYEELMKETEKKIKEEEENFEKNEEKYKLQKGIEKKLTKENKSLRKDVKELKNKKKDLENRISGKKRKRENYEEEKKRKRKRRKI